MVRASVVASISLAFFVGCGKQPSGLDAGETHTDETQSSLGEGNDDGDGDPVLLDPCDWVPVPASACSTPFEPAPAELPPPAMAESGVFSEVDIIAHADRVEVLWTRGYSIDNEHVEERRYVSSNVQGAWQHEFLITAPYEFVSAPYLFSPQIDGSPSRTQVRPPTCGARTDSGSYLSSMGKPIHWPRTRTRIHGISSSGPMTAVT